MKKQQSPQIRIAYPMRVDALTKPGGDLLQVQQYIATGTTLLAKGESSFSGAILTDPTAPLNDFDLVHLTNIDRPIETFAAFRAAKAARKPIVISTIHHSYTDIRHYERFGRAGIISLISRHLTFTSLELGRTLLRARKYPALQKTLWQAPRGGTKQAQKTILKGADRILVLSEKEANDITSDFGVSVSEKITLLRNGIDPLPPENVSLNGNQTRDIEVCVVGRIEARKNQIAILNALNHLGMTGVFVGSENPFHETYCRHFRKLISESNSVYLGPLSRAETARIMQRSMVHVSASWFEVLPLVDIEAYRAGCRVVASVTGGTSELLGADAAYVHPDSPEELTAAIKRQSEIAFSRASGGKSAHLPTWVEVTTGLSELYRTLIPIADDRRTVIG